MSDQRWPVQSKPCQGEFADWSPRKDSAVSKQEEVAVAGVVPRVPQQRIGRGGRPVGRLVEVTPPAAVHQVIGGIGTTERLRVMVINRQLAAAVGFSHAAILAGKARPGPD